MKPEKRQDADYYIEEYGCEKEASGKPRCFLFLIVTDFLSEARLADGNLTIHIPGECDKAPLAISGAPKGRCTHY